MKSSKSQNTLWIQTLSADEIPYSSYVNNHFTGFRWRHCEENEPSSHFWYLWWTNDSRTVQHDCREAGWLPPWSRHVGSQCLIILASWLSNTDFWIEHASGMNWHYLFCWEITLWGQKQWYFFCPHLLLIVGPLPSAFQLPLSFLNLCVFTLTSIMVELSLHI